MVAAAHVAWIDGIACWTSAWPGWDAARVALRAGAESTAAAPAPSVAGRKPSPALLAPNERRRAPDAVLLALEVATAAMAMSGHSAATTASVFTSAHGDLATTDALCRTLATDPLLLSPTRFHHSVHNAASGYWAIASGSRAPSTALSAHAHSFAAGLLEALTLCAADGAPVLLVGHDTEACGALANVNPSRGLLALALVLSPVSSGATQWQLAWSLDPTGAAPSAPRSAAAQSLAANAMACALPLFEALASGDRAMLSMPLGPGPALGLRLVPAPAGVACS